MRIITPEYCDRFSCLADRCSDNCCIGWEIDIDENTMNKYRALRDPFGERLTRCISSDEPYHFILSGGERCPFLNDRNLCDIITELGDSYLCDICREHPRYYNIFGDYVEGGIGLACEAATDIILNAEFPIGYTEHYTDDAVSDADISRDLLEWSIGMRDFLYKEIFRKDRPVIDSFYKLLAASGKMNVMALDYMTKKRAANDHFSSEFQGRITEEILRRMLLATLGRMTELEALDDSWYAKLNYAYRLIDKDLHRLLLCIEASSDHLRRLAFYFLHRHFLCGIYDIDYCGRVRFALISSVIIYAMAYNDGNVAYTDLALAAKDYSKNIEYSTENVEELILLLQDYI